MRDRNTSTTSIVRAVVVAFWVGVTVGAAWATYVFHPMALLYSAGVAVGLAVISLVLVWLWGAIFVHPVRSSGGRDEAPRES
jgi:hypothetical protein